MTDDELMAIVDETQSSWVVIGGEMKLGGVTSRITQSLRQALTSIIDTGSPDEMLIAIERLTDKVRVNPDRAHRLQKGLGLLPVADRGAPGPPDIEC